MTVNQSEKTKLIRQYFECLKKRRTATESFGEQVIADFLEHLKNKRAPREGIFVYVVVGGLLVSLLISPTLTFILAVVVLIISQQKTPVKIKMTIDEERQIDKWLLEGKRKLFQKAPNELGLILGVNPPQALNVVLNQDAPIALCTGFIKDSPSSQDTQDYLIEDYFVEKGLDGNTRYSIHVFLVIFLCKNFMAYYKCHWNFINNVETLVETGEYLYDTIVSVKTQEMSLAMPGNDTGNRLTYKKILQISTTDSKDIEFPVITDIRLTSDQDSITVKDAAHIIREMLRERRIDMQIVKPFDADD
ncbi:MAG: hypothetical protein JGK04_07440 [Microcoleus sp. PH2017_39_LGB_O_B]|uniref:hypothetical protein n=1 Tax=unclassified Microcoleus TaxID=2642155 RepID=UPI001D4074B5|nr:MULTISPECIES: hypothetical protein [unclassified Microcoleus]MCC3510126.1 hypothetical protein [Microcoleus sp. PH2017_17_BER_D_A]TAF91488.1 MAG: hypothetical protein EAZ49_05555 [Oscillatoriales cyanobacterium]MCC3447290.1 hypothetical protein [Microcoleus sp. PH2017_09_SFU_O_A]MCC3628274.1 hypothetical protein [Microcoleus sp. PH2017_39_LGB_O_B]MCC3640362.1 hypothetical protein [Microcoleus sp. PH2017_33_LGB_O_A]